MKKGRIVLIIISLLFIVLPFFINVYSIYKLISIGIGIILLDTSFAMNKKTNIFLLFYLPIILIIFTYSLDYIKTYTLNLSPIYVLENKINEKVSIYNSLFYRVYKCDQEYIFDNDYQKSFACNTNLIENIDINKLLNEPKENFKEYKNSFIKVTGKISKIIGTSSIELKEYTIGENSINGYVKFNETSKLIVNLNGVNISNYKIYDYITVVGLLDSFDSKSREMILINSKIEENNLYDAYDLQVILSNSCSEQLKEYTDNFYTKCIENIYVDYKIDKYELSYAIKDKKILYDDFIAKSTKKEVESKTVYEFEKFNILVCSKDKNIILNKDEEIKSSICDEEIIDSVT